ncbi:MAG TPA: hypothetical protein VIW24_23305 [Aldersonia sp.]
MIVDCNECVVRGDACAECVVTVVLGLPEVRRGAPDADPGRRREIRLEQEERAALDVLAEQGLVPRLRLVTSRLPSPGGAKGENRAV